MLSDSDRVTQIDKKFDGNVSDQQFTNQLFVRLVAKQIHFTNVDFKYSIFDSCYLRSCAFDSCDFIGCRFIGSTLDGSAFSGCKFDYATFERTSVDSDILSQGCPGYENLKMRFARSLRMNYQQLGDAKSVNKAMEVELQATEAHLHKAWSSTESYYRRKYTRYKRFQLFTEWVSFRILDFLWGNGESAPKLVRAILLALFLVAMFDATAVQNPSLFKGYTQAVVETSQVFLGRVPPTSYPHGCLTFLLALRLAVFGFLTAIIVKRFNRR
jgi:hypothetical protein